MVELYIAAFLILIAVFTAGFLFGIVITREVYNFDQEDKTDA